MNSPAVGELMQLESAHRQTEQARAEAAEEERAAFVHRQESYGTYEIARDEASTASAAWVEAIVP
jgi:hypothetical protein